MESYQKKNKLNPMPIILCGDWNGSKRGHVYKFLRSQGFVSSYDTAHHYTDADAHKVSVFSFTPNNLINLLVPVTNVFQSSYSGLATETIEETYVGLTLYGFLTQIVTGNY